MIGLEDFLRIVGIVGQQVFGLGMALAEYLLPGPGHLAAVFAPDPFKFRKEPAFMAGEILHEVGRNLTLPGLLGGRGEVSDGTQDSHLVLHLHHDYGVVLVDFLDMLHQGRIGVSVRLQGCLTEGGQYVEEPAAGRLHERIGDRIALDIAGCISGVAVLPAGEPDHHHLEPVLACVPDYMVDGGKIVMAGLVFNHIPGAGSDYRVEMAVFHLLPHPDALHVAFRCARGVVQLARQHQERLSIHLEMGNPVLLDKRRLYRRVFSILRASRSH